MTEILAEIDIATDPEHIERIRAEMQDRSLGSRYIDMGKLAADQQQCRENRLMPNEWIKAQRFGKDYWRYVVVNCQANPQLFLIQDPASTLHPREKISVVRYMVGLQDWKRAAVVG